jgi:hypothetical protein
VVGYYGPTTVVCACARRLRKLLFVYVFFIYCPKFLRLAERSLSLRRAIFASLVLSLRMNEFSSCSFIYGKVALYIDNVPWIGGQ